MKTGEQKPIRLGLAGAGLAVRRLHWPVLRALRKEIQVCAVASRTRETAEEVAGLVGAERVYEDYRGLLDDPDLDAILIALPITLNGRVLIEAIQAGKHVLAEKPIAATGAEAREVLRHCANARQVVAIAENFRYRDDVLKAREVIERGEIGKVFAFRVSALFHVEAEVRRCYLETQWRREPQYAGGFVLDAGVHAIAGLRDLLGDVTQVYAQVPEGHSSGAAPDTILMQIGLENGAAGQYLACYTAIVAKENTFDFTAYGTRGELRLGQGNVAWITEAGGPVNRFRTRRFDKGYRRQWQNFCRAIRGEEAVLSTPEKAYADLLVVEAALRSAETGSLVRLRQEVAAQ